MNNKFVVKNKKLEQKKKDDSTVISVRIANGLLEKYDKLAAKSGHSRNVLIVNGLEFAIENLEYIDER